jgi:hypothetical protein
MPAINLHLDGDACWPDLKGMSERLADGRVIHLGNDSPPIGMALLAGGMVSGKPSVTLRLDLPDGRVVLAETSLELLTSAVRAMHARLAP